MPKPNLAAVVMAAGLGTRMHSATPKHMHALLGRRMIDWVLETAEAVEADRVVVVSSPPSAAGLAGLEGVTIAVQEHPLGTGDAVASAHSALDGFSGDVLVLSGDTPLLTPQLVLELLAEHRAQDAAVTVLSFEPPDPGAYGRVLRAADGSLRAIVEARDATAQELATREVNSSIYVFAADALWPALASLDARNAQGELYLTDTVASILADGGKAAAYLSPDPVEPLGVNTRAELAAAAAVLRRRINDEHMLAGVTIIDPETTWIEADVELEPDAIVHPFTVLRGRTRVGAKAEIGPHAVAVDAVMGEGALVGPFCYLRPGTVLEPGSKAGTFVEIKNSRIGERTKVPHLSYLGDADVGEDTNVAAGNITVNLSHRPGVGKRRTRIGRNVKTGVHDTFVAPVEIGDDVWVAAGSVITEDVPAGSLAGFPPRQVTKEGWVHEHGKPDD
jgi:bifunctional UDP-N-acetylglucosamine pyrophosphorylase/glucosamine-1-phosphate N-acetyltransferase